MDEVTIVLATIGDLELTRRKQVLEIQRLTQQNELLGLENAALMAANGGTPVEVEEHGHSH